MPVNKAEVIHRRSWKTRESVELATLQWVSWFNRHRTTVCLSLAQCYQRLYQFDRPQAIRS